LKLAVAVVAVFVAIVSPRVASVRLPRDLNFYSIEPEGRSLLVVGDTASGGRCEFVRVGKTPLKVTARGPISCLRTSAAPVFPVLRYDRKDFTVRVRIAHLEPRTHGVVEGPVAMTFQQFSDTHLETAYGPGTLWLFDSKTAKGAEVVEVSATTGRVENVVRMPRITRPVLAADNDGLWLAIAPNGSAPRRGPAPLYHVPPGARAPVLVHRGGRAALWMVAAGHSVVADILSGEKREALWLFKGGSGRARELASADELDDWAASFSTDGASVWTVREMPTSRKYFECDSLQVIRIDAASGRQRVTATIRTPGSPCYGTTYATFAGGAFAFIYGSTLYRVAS
jgi:hypothetical protein